MSRIGHGPTPARFGATLDENTVPLGQGGTSGGLERGTQPTRRVATTVAARHSSDGGTLNGVFHAAGRATFDENVRAARVR